MRPRNLKSITMAGTIVIRVDVQFHALGNEAVMKAEADIREAIVKSIESYDAKTKSPKFAVRSVKCPTPK